jgi:hypothetical protein
MQERGGRGSRAGVLLLIVLSEHVAVAAGEKRRIHVEARV